MNHEDFEFLESAKNDLNRPKIGQNNVPRLTKLDRHLAKYLLYKSWESSNWCNSEGRAIVRRPNQEPFKVFKAPLCNFDLQQKFVGRPNVDRFGCPESGLRIVNWEVAGWRFFETIPDRFH